MFSLLSLLISPPLLSFSLSSDFPPFILFSNVLHLSLTIIILSISFLHFHLVLHVISFCSSLLLSSYQHPSLHNLHSFYLHLFVLHLSPASSQITISRGEECVLEDNSQRTKWKVISPTGNEAMVPSVCFTIPPPNQEAIDTAGR